MHATANKVEIPLDQVERFLINRAVPDFTGNVEISVRVLQTAGHEIEFRSETESLIATKHSEETATPLVTNERVNAVRRALAEIRGRFTIGTDVQKIRASFVKGELRSFKLCEVEE